MKFQVGGIILVVFGGIFLLENLGIANIQFGKIISTWWPLLMIFWGVQMLLKKDKA